MLMEKLANKKLFLFLVFIFLLITIFIFKNIAVKFEKKEYEGVFFKKPFPLIVIKPQNNLIDSTSFLILIENDTDTNSFLSKLESRIGSIEGKLIKVLGELLTNNGTRFMEISSNPESIYIVENQNTYPSEQTKTKKIILKGRIIDLKCVTKNDFSRECFNENIYKESIPALSIYRNKENLNYLFKIKDHEIINNYLKKNFNKIVKVFGEYYYQNGFNIINLDSISSIE